MEKEQVFSIIKKEMIQNGSWFDVAKFKCISDHIITYKIEKEGLLTELNIISDDAFFESENPIEIFRKKRIVYLEHRVFIKNGLNWEQIGSKSYNELSV